MIYKVPQPLNITHYWFMGLKPWKLGVQVKCLKSCCDTVLGMLLCQVCDVLLSWGLPFLSAFILEGGTPVWHVGLGRG
jgi:hypothetical protein